MTDDHDPPVPDPISGDLGMLVLAGWVAQAPTGRDEAFLLLTTDDGRAPETMPMVADLLGLTETPGRVTTSGEVYVSIAADGWLTLHVPGDERYVHPGGDEWRATATATGQVVLVVGTAPMPPGMDADTYVHRYGDTCRLGLIPLRSPPG